MSKEHISNLYKKSSYWKSIPSRIDHSIDPNPLLHSNFKYDKVQKAIEKLKKTEKRNSRLYKTVHEIVQCCFEHWYSTREVGNLCGEANL